MPKSGGGGNKNIMYALAAGGVVLAGIAFVAALGFSGGNQTRDAKAQQRIDLANAKEKALVDNLSLIIDTCAALKTNLAKVQDTQARIVALPDELAKSKKADGTNTFSDVDMATIRDLSTKSNTILSALITLAKNCNGAAADKTVSTQWITVHDIFAQITALLPDSLAVLLIQSIDEDQLAGDDGTLRSGNNGVPLIYQRDFAKVAWPQPSNSKTTIASSGCGIAATAMVFAYYNNNQKLINKIPNADIQSLATYTLKNGFRTDESGVGYGFWKKFGKEYGLQVDDAFPGGGKGKGEWDRILTYLKAGKPVIVSGVGGPNPYVKDGRSICGGSPFGCKGHFVVLTGIASNGDINVNDSNPRAYKLNSYPQSTIKTYMHSARVIWANIP